MKRIGILTSGGDCPGMNAAIAAATWEAFRHGMEMLGVHKGFDGLITGEIEPIDPGSVDGVIQRGGTILQTSRSPEFRTPEGQKKALRNLGKYQLQGIVVLGGGGSFEGAKVLEEAGFPTVSIPATIDNDIAGTDYTIGFDTACNKAIKAIDDIRDTALSLEGRIFIVETLGGATGFIALATAYAAEADYVLIPEIEFDIEEVCRKVKASFNKRKGYSLLVVSEGIGNTLEVSKEVEKRVGKRVRLTMMGHQQRGGFPSFFDRTLAKRMAVKAVNLLGEGEHNKMVGIVGAELRPVDLDFVIRTKKPIDREIYDLINKNIFL